MKKILVAILVLGLVGLAGRSYYRTALQRPTQSESQILRIDPGLGVSEIADLLYEKGLINSKTLFKVYLQLTNLGTNLQAGEYQLSDKLNLLELVSLLQHGKFEVKLTFPEGWRREQMAARIDETTGLSFTGNDFLEASAGLEGYLFPETYYITAETTAAQLVLKMQATFDTTWNRLVAEYPPSVFSQSEIVILASLVERETRFDEDRPLVAGVLINRFQNDWPLDVDATVQYAVGSASDWWPQKLTEADLVVDSPYNTRKYKELPPTPICNPGVHALAAVFDYTRSNYWFYVSDTTGKIYFAETLDEHNQNILKYVPSG